MMGIMSYRDGQGQEAKEASGTHLIFTHSNSSTWHLKIGASGLKDMHELPWPTDENGSCPAHRAEARLD